MVRPTASESAVGPGANSIPTGGLMWPHGPSWPYVASWPLMAVCGLMAPRGPMWPHGPSWPYVASWPHGLNVGGDLPHPASCGLHILMVPVAIGSPMAVQGRSGMPLCAEDPGSRLATQRNPVRL